MQKIKCIFGDNTKGKFRVTHNKIYEVFSYENCDYDEFWIICDDGSKGKFCLTKYKNIKEVNSISKLNEVFFVDVNELRDNKINEILNI